MDLLSKTFEKSTNVFSVLNGGERIANLKYVIARIYEGNLKTTYTIHRDSRSSVHTIEMSKGTNHFDRESRYKIYEDVELFERAIKRIQKICDKAKEVEISCVG